MAVATKSRASGTTSVLAQVAKKACVSSGTVSRVFNNSELIPDGTRSRVLSAARELGFRPRVGVRTPQIALITGASRGLGVALAAARRAVPL